jgi:hypothetical protein
LDRSATPARVSLGVTTVLTITTLLSSANNNLPATAYPKVREREKEGERGREREREGKRGKEREIEGKRQRGREGERGRGRGRDRERESGERGRERGERGRDDNDSFVFSH